MHHSMYDEDDVDLSVSTFGLNHCILHLCHPLRTMKLGYRKDKTKRALDGNRSMRRFIDYQKF